MSGFKYGNYEVFPYGQQLRNEDDTTAKWMALASIVRWSHDKIQAVPVSWYPPEFDTEKLAREYAAHAAKEMIDAGRCKI
jgi:hypothetical protein